MPVLVYVPKLLVVSFCTSKASNVSTATRQVDMLFCIDMVPLTTKAAAASNS
jgi:hypothetical protein